MLADKLRKAEKPFFGHQRAIALDGSYPLEGLVGQKPAFVGFPLNDILRARPKKGAAIKKFTDQLTQAYKLGQVIEFDWHAIHPVYPETKTYTVDGKKKTFGPYKYDPFNPAKNIKSVLESEAFYSQLDEIASFFLGLQSNGVEFLFRPFHEMNLEVFWWGKEHNTPEDYRKLYQTTVKYLRDKGCNPLFVFAPNYRGGLPKYYENYYPGDDCVNVCGLDWYYPNQREGVEVANFLFHFAFAHDKILAFTECGPRLGGFQKLTPDQKAEYFPSLLEFLGSADFKYVRFWSITPADPDDDEGSYVPTEEPEITYFKEQFLPHVQLL